MNSVPKLFSCSYADCWTEKHFSTEFSALAPNHTHSHTLFWGYVSRWFGRALAWHARGHRFDPGNLHQKEKHCTEMCSAFLCPFRLAAPSREKCVWSTPQSATNAKLFIKNLSAEYGQSEAETISNRPAHRGQTAKRLQLCSP